MSQKQTASNKLFAILVANLFRGQLVHCIAFYFQACAPLPPKKIRTGAHFVDAAPGASYATVSQTPVHVAIIALYRYLLTYLLARQLRKNIHHPHLVVNLFQLLFCVSFKFQFPACFAVSKFVSSFFAEIGKCQIKMPGCCHLGLLRMFVTSCSSKIRCIFSRSDCSHAQNSINEHRYVIRLMQTHTRTITIHGTVLLNEIQCLRLWFLLRISGKNQFA